MIVEYGIIFSDLDEQWFFTVGPFRTKAEAKEFEAESQQCNLITSVHPWVIANNWRRRILESPIEWRDEVDYIGLCELRNIS